MPTYVYRCRECDQDLEVIQHFNEEPLKVCPRCGGPLYRVLFPPAIIFKGSGWYATDHKSPSGGNGGKSSEKSVEKAASGADAEKGTDSASETAPKPSTSDEA